MQNVIVMDHPLIKHKISRLRMIETGSKGFREIVSELAQFMCFEATRELPLEDYEIITPFGETVGQRIAGKNLAIVPILRAGLGMVDGILDIIPTARVGHIGLYHDPETLQPVEYYCKAPNDIEERELYVLDTTLATGTSAVAAIRFLKEKGANNIKFLCLIAAPEGIAHLLEVHPDITIYVCQIDETVDENGYILPGLGDSGDRLFGTK
ncbi:MAG: uracil phosphoribosyltransferase [Epulopiscium sp. Nele67-Bin004]|nr:MAG: uracil phosphoribosyltransferase [Epulopiscium sp. Nele67-Bin004]